MSEKLKKAPVYYVVAQVRFNAIPKLQDAIEDIQAQMSPLGFPDYTTKKIYVLTDEIQAAPKLDEQVMPQFSSETWHLFGNMERTSLFLLERNALSFQTTDYDTFLKFSHNVGDFLCVVQKVLKPTFTTRIGLRYLDAVIPQRGKSVAWYLKPEVHGLQHAGDARFAYASSQSRLQKDNMLMTSRVYIREGKVGLPPDLRSAPPKILPRFTDPDGKHAIIDTDVLLKDRSEFVPDAILAQLKKMHDEGIEVLFHAIVSENARKAWK